MNFDGRNFFIELSANHKSVFKSPETAFIKSQAVLYLKERT